MDDKIFDRINDVDLIKEGHVYLANPPLYKL